MTEPCMVCTFATSTLTIVVPAIKLENVKKAPGFMASFPPLLMRNNLSGDIDEVGCGEETWTKYMKYSKALLTDGHGYGR